MHEGLVGLRPSAALSHDRCHVGMTCAASDKISNTLVALITLMSAEGIGKLTKSEQITHFGDVDGDVGNTHAQPRIQVPFRPGRGYRVAQHVIGIGERDQVERFEESLT